MLHKKWTFFGSRDWLNAVVNVLRKNRHEIADRSGYGVRDDALLYDHFYRYDGFGDYGGVTHWPCIVNYRFWRLP